jgi:hypothetical protein
LAAFASCPGPAYQPGADLAPGDYTFRIRADGAGGRTANATRTFTVVDCATLEASLATASAAAKKANKALRKAKRSENPRKIKKAKRKLRKARTALRAASAALAAEPVCA